jgi:hypothetical protein
MRALPAVTAVLLGAAAGAAVAAAAPPLNRVTPAVGAADPRLKGAARVVVETLAVDRRGTWTVGSDEAEIFPGHEAVLEKSATLIGRQEPERREMVQVTARFTPVIKADGVCALKVESEARAVASGAGKVRPPAERRAAAVEIAPDKEKYVEAYSSSITGARLGFKVRCALAGGSGSSPASVPDGANVSFADFDLDIARGQDGGTVEPLKNNRLRAILGRKADNLFAFNVPLPESPQGDKRYRREQVEIGIHPEVISAGRIQVRIVMTGQIATVSGDGTTIPHSFEKEDTAVLAPGGSLPLEVEVTSGGAGEGWSWVLYRLLVTARF